VGFLFFCNDICALLVGKLEFTSSKRQSLLDEKDCGLLQRTHFVRTFAGREEFFATYTPRQKTPKIDFAAAAAKLCEASSPQVRSRDDPCGRPFITPINSNFKAHLKDLKTGSFS